MATIRQKLSTYAVTYSSSHQRRSHFQRTANAALFIATLFRYREQGKFSISTPSPGSCLDHVHVAHHSGHRPEHIGQRCFQLIKGGYCILVGTIFGSTTLRLEARWLLHAHSTKHRRARGPRVTGGTLQHAVQREAIRLGRRLPYNTTYAVYDPNDFALKSLHRHPSQFDVIAPGPEACEVRENTSPRAALANSVLFYTDEAMGLLRLQTVSLKAACPLRP